MAHWAKLKSFYDGKTEYYVNLEMISLMFRAEAPTGPYTKVFMADNRPPVEVTATPEQITALMARDKAPSS
jgi:hypothetical protein